MARRSARRRDRAEERPGRSLTLRVWRSQGFEVMGRHGCLRRRGVEEESGKPVFLGFLAQLLQWFIKVSNRSTELFDTQTPCSSFPPFHHTAPLKALPFPSLPFPRRSPRPTTEFGVARVTWIEHRRNRRGAALEPFATVLDPVLEVCHRHGFGTWSFGVRSRASVTS